MGRTISTFLSRVRYRLEEIRREAQCTWGTKGADMNVLELLHRSREMGILILVYLAVGFSYFLKERQRGVSEIAHDWDKGSLKGMVLKIFGQYVIRILGQWLTRFWAWRRGQKIKCSGLLPVKSCIFADSSRSKMLADPMVLIDCQGEPSIRGRSSRGR